MNADELLSALAERGGELPDELCDILRILLEKVERMETDLNAIREALAKSPEHPIPEVKIDEEFLERLTRAIKTSRIGKTKEKPSDYLGRWRDLTADEERCLRERLDAMAAMWKRWNQAQSSVRD